MSFDYTVGMHDLVNYEGRIGRLRFIGVAAFVSFAWYVVKRTIQTGSGDPFSIISFMIFSALCFWVTACNYIKRLHDLNRPGTELLLMMIPFVNLYYYVILLGSPGTAGPNDFGLPPGAPPNMSLPKGKAAHGKAAQQTMIHSYDD